MTQRMLEITSPNFISEEALAGGGDPARSFEAQSPLALEIGCGIGDFIVRRAAQQPGTNFLAIDIYNKGCLKTCRKVDDADLDNVRVMRIEARYLLTRYLAPESLAAVYINCPDPWPKKRHRSRRLVNRQFLELLLYSLQPGGEFYFSTDFDDYAQQVAELLPAVDGFDNCLTSPFSHGLPGYPISKYMRRFLERDQLIHFIHYRKQEGYRLDELPPATVGRGFRMPRDMAGNE